jgi:hypothetical protein
MVSTAYAFVPYLLIGRHYRKLLRRLQARNRLPRATRITHLVLVQPLLRALLAQPPHPVDPPQGPESTRR